jgi:hypothetical protein
MPGSVGVAIGNFDGDRFCELAVLALATVSLSDRSQSAYQKVLERHPGGGVGSGQRRS